MKRNLVIALLLMSSLTNAQARPLVNELPGLLVVIHASTDTLQTGNITREVI